MKKDLNQIASLEKAIKEKYGEEAIQNPKKSWNEEKEKRYLEDLKEFYKKREKNRKTEEREGFLIRDKKSLTAQKRTCPVCGSYSFSAKDDLYMNKFDCCFECYVQHVEDREERWKTGWRPNK